MKTLFAAAVAVSLLTGTVTTAHADNDRHHDGRHYDNRDHGRDHRDHGGDKRWHRDDNRRDYRGHDRHNDHRRYERDYRGHDHDRRWDRRDAYRAGYWDGRRFDRGRYIPPRGYHVRHWRHGDYLPRAYYSSSYIVRDYHVYHLGAPPRGHHWVRVNNDVVLAAIASGLVVSVVDGLFY